MKSHIVLATSLNLRSAPHVDNSTKLAALPLGTLVDELDANADRSWLRVRIGALEGWMNNSYLLRAEAYDAYPWLPIAVGEFGVSEIAGPKNNPRVQAYLSTVISGVPTEETAWCSAFAKWCVLQARAIHSKVPDPKKITASARSWHTSKWGNDVTTPAPLGSVVVLWRRRAPNEKGATEADRSGTAEEVRAKGNGGHVGFLASPFKPGDTQINLIGGNQRNSVCKGAYQLGNAYGVLSIRSA